VKEKQIVYLTLFYFNNQKESVIKLKIK